jgi:NAD(P)-dependent dehydrogenase (short-subunit alcohol dehydrogenase family)
MLLGHETILSINFPNNTIGSQEDGSWAEGLTEDEETAKECLGTNYYGTKRITKALIPLLKPSTAEARIVNVSSVLGLLKVQAINSFFSTQCHSLLA